MNHHQILVVIILIISQACEPVRTESASEPLPSPQLDDTVAGQVDSLSQLPVMQAAFESIEDIDHETIKDLITLTEIEAPPFKENNRGNKYFNMLYESGADTVWTDSVGNVIALRKGTVGQKTLAIAAHLDTVFPEGTPVKVQQRGDTLYAPGIADDTRGLVTLLAILKTMKTHDLRTKDNILFIGNVGEEGIGDLRGTKHLFKILGDQIDYFISVDGTDSESIVNRGLGSHRYRVTIHGPGGHSWGAFGLANPHHALASGIHHFVQEADRYTSSGIKTSYNIGRIGGGTSINSIPFTSWLEVDMRSESPKRLTEIDSLFQRAIRKGLKEQNQISRGGRKLTLQMDLIGNRPSGSTPSDNSLVQRAWASTSHFGFEPQLKISSTDSNVPISLGIPAITLGGGGIGKGAHSLGEYFVNKEGYKGIQRVFMVVILQCGIGSAQDGNQF